jgi:cysteine synthase
MPDPEGSIFYHHYHGDKNGILHSYRVEGAGKDKVGSIMDFDYIDDVYQFTDDDAFSATKKLAMTEGILAGGSSGGALFAAEKLSERFSVKMHHLNVVIILPDSGFKYLSVCA